MLLMRPLSESGGTCGKLPDSIDRFGDVLVDSDSRFSGTGGDARLVADGTPSVESARSVVSVRACTSDTADAPPGAAVVDAGAWPSLCDLTSAALSGPSPWAADHRGCRRAARHHYVVVVRRRRVDREHALLAEILGHLLGQKYIAASQRVQKAGDGAQRGRVALQRQAQALREQLADVVARQRTQHDVAKVDLGMYIVLARHAQRVEAVGEARQIAAVARLVARQVGRVGRCVGGAAKRQEKYYRIAHHRDAELQQVPAERVHPLRVVKHQQHRAVALVDDEVLQALAQHGVARARVEARRVRRRREAERQHELEQRQRGQQVRKRLEQAREARQQHLALVGAEQRVQHRPPHSVRLCARALGAAR
jgi:hypothetical protein